MASGVLRDVASGHPAAMNRCIEQYGRLVWSIARKLTVTKADAEDAAQEVFLQIWMHANRFDDTLGSEASFIATITRRRLIDKLRKKAAEPVFEAITSYDEENRHATADGREYAEMSIDGQKAQDAMAELKPQQRAVLELGFLHGLSHPEIAEQLNVPLGTVKSHMRRGLLRTREVLKDIASQATRRTRE